MILEVDYQAIEAIKLREETQRNSLPPHTLDWYTYDNRVQLIAEIERQIHEIADISAAVKEIVNEEPSIQLDAEIEHPGSE